MLTVALVLRTGGAYTPQYVRRLALGIQKNLHVKHRIVCLSDEPAVAKYCEHEPLKTDWSGWWAKLELFRHFTERTLYFDLDTIVRKDITPMARFPHHFTMLSDILFPQRPASGVMAWNGDFSRLARGFKMDYADKYRRTELWGDQGWIMSRLKHDPQRFQTLFPGMIASWKRSDDAQKRKAAVICYHGSPRPHETGWRIFGAPQRRRRTG